MNTKDQNAHSVPKYTVIVTYDPVESVYYANIPALGTVTHGESDEEAYAMAQEVIALWVDSALKLGEELPVDNFIGAREVAAPL